jgi:hypothetical protein
MDDHVAVLQNVQNRTISIKSNIVSIKEEPPEVNNESHLIYFENTERHFDFNSEENQEVHSATPLVCIHNIFVTV